MLVSCHEKSPISKAADKQKVDAQEAAKKIPADVADDLLTVKLRYKQPDAPRPWRVPLNLKLGSFELPVGLILIAAVLFACAIVNLFTKQVATMAEVAATIMPPLTSLLVKTQ